MLNNVEWLGHSTVKILVDKTIYIDPYNIKDNLNDADIIFITHNHYDHFSKEDIKKCIQEDTKIVITEDLYSETLKMGFKENNILCVSPNKDYELDNIYFETIPAYNNDKNFHPKTNNWVGYVLSINSIKYYIAGDTDITKEAKQVNCDIAFLPIGGTYTMNYKEAATLANEIKPQIVIPIHYGTIVGTKKDALNFKMNLEDSIKCEFLR